MCTDMSCQPAPIPTREEKMGRPEEPTLECKDVDRDVTVF